MTGFIEHNGKIEAALRSPLPNPEPTQTPQDVIQGENKQTKTMTLICIICFSKDFVPVLTHNFFFILRSANR